MSAGNIRVTPEQLIALNDEIALLVRAGVSLELGLRERGDSVSGALRHVNEELSRHMESGISLGASLAATIPGLPRVYSAVIDAGLRSGTLPRAVESLSRMARQGIELRQRIEFAFLYPLIVFSIAYGLFLLLVVESHRRWELISGDYQLNRDPFVQFMTQVSTHWQVWTWIPPVLVAIPVIWWLVYGRASFLPDRRPSALLAAIPGLGSVMTYWQWGGFCDLLATLLEHQVPLPEAILLAADASGNSTIQSQMTGVVAHLQSGHSIADSMRDRRQIPAYLRWSLATAHEPAAFQNALRHGHELFQARANFRTEAIKLWLPPVLLVLIGGGAAFVYALMWALPLRLLYWQLIQDGF